ncbi:NACHT domain-containing protein [Nonomuraea insulae]|uniref:NACHT domain-containing protein n=1 Tax=Nonomuraea insulae TaxID=1616787 RepID=A0ABW1CUR0_9ACTN
MDSNDWPYPDPQLQPSVMLRRGSSEVEEGHRQSSSAFIAHLTSDPRCTIVTGLAGSGKTTLLRRIATQIAIARENGESRYAPLLLSCGAWTEGSELANWAAKQTRHKFGIPSEITWAWISRGSVVLLLDGADEILDKKSRESFIFEVNRWLNSPIGGRVILSCRTDAYVNYFQRVQHEQVADLEPLSQEVLKEYFKRLLSERISDPLRRANTQSLLRKIAATVPNEDPGWSTPLVVRILTDAVMKAAGPAEVETQADPGALAVGLGDSLSKKGDVPGAIESYMAAIRNRSSQWRSLATLRAYMLLAQSGDYQRANSTLAQSIASEIERPLRSELMPVADHLSADEHAVLAALSPSISYDPFQVSSMASIPPSRCNSALRQLRERGLVDVVDTDSTNPRFQRSAVELIER